MATRFRVRELIEEINAVRDKLGVPRVTDAAIARDAHISRRTLQRLMNDDSVGRELLDVMDRLMAELTVITGRLIGPGDILIRDAAGYGGGRSVPKRPRALPKRKGGRPSNPRPKPER